MSDIPQFLPEVFFESFPLGFHYRLEETARRPLVLPENVPGDLRHDSATSESIDGQPAITVNQLGGVLRLLDEVLLSFGQSRSILLNHFHHILFDNLMCFDEVSVQSRA